MCKKPKKLTTKQIERLFNRPIKPSRNKYSDALEWATKQANHLQRTPLDILSEFVNEKYEFIMIVKSGKITIRQRTLDEIEFNKKADKLHERHIRQLEKKLNKKAMNEKTRI